MKIAQKPKQKIVKIAVDQPKVPGRILPIEKKVKELVKETRFEFDNYLQSRKNLIQQLPRLAFLSLYKNSTYYDTRTLSEIYSKNIVKIVSSYSYRHSSNFAIYIDCKACKFVSYNHETTPTIEILSTFFDKKDCFDLDKIYQKYLDSSSEELFSSVFDTTKSKRKNDHETALNYVLHLLDKSSKIDYQLTYEDLKIHIGKNKLLNKYLQTEAEFQEMKNEGIVRSATKLLKT